MNPNSWAHALQILSHAQAELDAEYQARSKHIDHARMFIAKQWDQFRIAYDTYMSDLQADTPKKTAAEIRRSFERQRNAIRKYEKEVEAYKKK